MDEIKLEVTVNRDNEVKVVFDGEDGQEDMITLLLTELLSGKLYLELAEIIEEKMKNGEISAESYVTISQAVVMITKMLTTTENEPLLYPDEVFNSPKSLTPNDLQ